MARTNKRGIAKQKAQQAKQKKLMKEAGIPKTHVNNGLRRKYTNPQGNEYERFMRSGKWINHITSCREDPDGFRIQRKANGGEINFVHIGETSRGRKRRKRKSRKITR